jgi:hypothetical protein
MAGDLFVFGEVFEVGALESAAFATFAGLGACF